MLLLRQAHDVREAVYHMTVLRFKATLRRQRPKTCKGCEGRYHQLEGCFIAFPGHPNKSTSFIEKLDSGGLSRRVQRWNELRTTPEVVQLVTAITRRMGWSNDLETNAQAGSEIQA
jgi:hypothetical protein